MAIARKYITEFALNMNMTHDMLLQQDDLYKVNEQKYFSETNPCHIYFICKRPRIILNPIDFKIENGRIYFPFQIQKENYFEKIYFDIPYSDDVDIKLECQYPYNFYYIKKNNKVIQSGKTALLFQTFRHENESLLNLEVLYIGQSYGVDGARTAPDRLKSHSTLQGIYSEAILRNPDSEIWLILASFEQIVLASIDGGIKIDDALLKKDENHVKNIAETIFHTGMKEQQVINFTEAALIRYFQPPYNKEYKDTFPNPAHKTYQECYGLDINSICIEVKTENINVKLYSQTVPASWKHMKDFFLHSREDRKSMFDF